MKKVLLIVIDALSARVVDPALALGKLPNLRQLQEQALRADSIAVFPSITPAATSSIATGRYPREHGISGAYWYLPAEKTVVYYGYDIWAILEEGIGSFIDDFLVQLNETHLQASTIFQTVDASSKRAASLNYLIFHGEWAHPLHEPLLLKLIPGAPSQQTLHGPALLYFGDFVSTPFGNDKTDITAPGGMTHRYGFADDNTGALLVEMAKRHAFPDFTLAYFPDNDFRSHEVGPEAALAELAETDAILGEAFAAYGGLEQVLQDLCIVITGDHSQSDVVNQPDLAGIRLDHLLADFAVADAGTPMSDEDDLVVCPNLRTAQIYFHTPTPPRLQRVMDALLADTRIDQVLWSAGLFSPDARGFHVRTRDRGELHFWPGADGPNTAIDVHGRQWSWQGNLRAVDGSVSKAGVLVFDEYPNAFERIAGVLPLAEAGHLWITSRPGHEFCLAHTKLHVGGGSHGSLHALDSISPLWVAGAPAGLVLPPQPRSVDLVPLCLTMLGITPDRTPGAPA